jgi:glycosyltransferase involved in cell wall biosynthesis
MSVERSIIVPCYNEAKNLPHLIERFARLRSDGASKSPSWELVLVDNGSVDETKDVLAKELAQPGREFVRVATVKSPNVGYGHGIMTGLRAAKGDRLAWTHADGQTPPADVLKAFDLLDASANPDRTFVKGRRRGRPTKDALFTLGMEACATAILGSHLADINAQPKAFTRRLLELATEPPIDLSLDLYFYWLAKKHGFEIVSFDVHFGDREHGESKWAFNWRSKARNIARSVKFMGALRTGSDYPRFESS